MSKARTFKVLSRLSKLAFDGGGITAERAIQRADERLESIRAPCLASLDQTLAEIDASFGRRAAGRADQPIGELYERCRRVITLALFAPGCELDAAARSLCRLLDLGGAAGDRSWDAVDVHLDAIKLLRARGSAMSASERAAIVGGLAKLSEKRVGKAKT